MNLTKLAMKRPVSTARVVLALVVFGFTAIPGFRLELTPDMELPMLLVYTVYPGADPDVPSQWVCSESAPLRRYLRCWIPQYPGIPD